jgi:hypothetical protein
MLYQLSYLGTALKPQDGLKGAAVYSQAGALCPPRYAVQPGIARRESRKASRGAVTPHLLDQIIGK